MSVWKPWVVVAGAALLLACGAKEEAGNKTEPTKATANTESNETKTAPKKRLPKGHAAYSGKATTGTEGMESAPDPKVVTLAGETVALSSTWKDGPSVIVFYRGHW